MSFHVSSAKAYLGKVRNFVRPRDIAKERKTMFGAHRP